MSNLTVSFTTLGWEDYLHWQRVDKSKLKRINELIRDIQRGDPSAGLGKPEPLKHSLAGTWSRRIDREHRLVYLVDGDQLIILQARHHYA